jgi:hypothetical protein
MDNHYNHTDIPRHIFELYVALEEDAYARMRAQTILDYYGKIIAEVIYCKYFLDSIIRIPKKDILSINGQIHEVTSDFKNFVNNISSN